MSPLTRIWWVLLLRGIVAVCLGLAAFMWPHHTLLALAYLFGVYAFSAGIFALWMGFHCVEQKNLMRSLLIEGVLGIGTGLLTIIDPQWFVMVGLYLIAASALWTGLLEIFSARELYREIPNDGHPGLMGLLSLLCGIAIIAFPHQSTEVFAWMVGGYAVAHGTIFILFAFRLRARHLNRLNSNSIK